MHRFTAEFGMGSGGSNALWSSRNSSTESWPVSLASANWVCDSFRCFVRFELSVRFVFTHRNLVPFQVSKLLGCYMVKPHGQLVLVSSTPHSAYTPNLSTSRSEEHTSELQSHHDLV